MVVARSREQWKMGVFVIGKGVSDLQNEKQCESTCTSELRTIKWLRWERTEGGRERGAKKHVK